MDSLAERLIERVHRLLQAGYASMTAADLSHYNRLSEPDITAGLAMRIQELIDSRSVPGITTAWSIVDNAPENALHLPLQQQPRAKKRKLPDLRLRYGGQRSSFYFRFEAKKLAGSGDYLDLLSHEDGLGRFLRRVYGRMDVAGGLLGYALTETVDTHAARVREALTTDSKKYHAQANELWIVPKWKHGPPCCFRAMHSREGGSLIVIYYSFLLFR